jgi:DNA-binding beta-propeller fold protein YncE
MLRFEGYVDLPAHRDSGGFDHAAVHSGLARMYVAHTANDALDVIDLEERRYIRSIEGLAGVAGALVAESLDLVFTSNRGEDTVGILGARDQGSLVKVPVGRRPNGLAFDPVRRILLVANVGDPGDPASHTATIVDADRAAVTGSIPLAGRTRWTIHDPSADRFFVNIAEPPSVVAIDGIDLARVAATIPIPVAGPHGLAVDEAGRLYVACDGARLLVVAAQTSDIVADLPLGGSPDVIFLDPVTRHLHVAIGDPGLIETFDVDRLEQVGALATERGAHTIGLDVDRHCVYAFLPASHRAAIYADHG